MSQPDQLYRQLKGLAVLWQALVLLKPEAYQFRSQPMTFSTNLKQYIYKYVDKDGADISGSEEQKFSFRTVR